MAEESAGFQSPVSPLRGQQGEQFLVRVCGVHDNPQGLPEAVMLVQFLQTRWLTATDVSGSVEQPLQHFAVLAVATAMIDSYQVPASWLSVVYRT